MANVSPDAVVAVRFIGFWPDYERYTFAAPAPPGWRWQTVDLRDTLEPRGPFRRMRRERRLRRHVPILQRELQTQSQTVHFFQDHCGVLAMLEQLSAPFFGGVLVRNPAQSERERFAQLLGLKAKGMRIWSFDPDDCARYGFEPYTQFLRKTDGGGGGAETVDIFFIGRDKGRAPLLDAIRRNAERAGLRTDIQILSAREQALPYSDYLERMRRARCIVDINQQGQTGWTLRPLEAGFHGKKLITNNANVTAAPGYRAQNTMIIDQAPSPQQIAAFLQTPTAAPSDEELRPFEATTVICSLAASARRRASLSPLA